MIAIACDHGGLELAKALSTWLGKRSIAFENLGTDTADSVDYPEYAHRLAAGVAEGRWERGILVCGTGIGMSMAANRHPGVRAALCSEPFSAAMCRRHNDANVLCLGGRVIGPELAFEILETFLETPFDGGRHERRIGKIEVG
jgi:ribose 5-phosphate isomerase B